MTLNEGAAKCQKSKGNVSEANVCANEANEANVC